MTMSSPAEAALPNLFDIVEFHKADTAATWTKAFGVANDDFSGPSASNRATLSDDRLASGFPHGRADHSACSDETGGPQSTLDIVTSSDHVGRVSLETSVCADDSPSDVRLKTDIEQVGMTVYGLPLYHFRYTNGDDRFEGVMAQDVLEVMPDAVSVGSDGFYRVNYRNLGISMVPVLPNLLDLIEASQSEPTQIWGEDLRVAGTDHAIVSSPCSDDPGRGVAPSSLEGLSDNTHSVCSDDIQAICSDDIQAVCSDDILAVCSDDVQGGRQEARLSAHGICSDELSDSIEPAPLTGLSVCADDASDSNLSDVRLKTDIEQVGTTVYGLPLFHFRYKTDEERFEGVMAQDVLQVMPDAVSVGGNGFYRVNYAKLGIAMTRV